MPPVLTLGADEVSFTVRNEQAMDLFSLPTALSISGTEYEIRTDFRVILEILVMLSDPDLSDADKTEALLRMFYVERPGNTAAAVEACLSFISSRRPSSGSPKGLVDWERDFPLIAAPVNRVLGTECRALPYLHWHSFLAAYMEIGPDCLFARVLRIREKLRAGKKLEKYEREFLRRNRDLIILPARLSARVEALLKEWT